MEQKLQIPPLAYIYFTYLAILPVLALMGLFQTLLHNPDFKHDNLSNGLLFMFLGSLAYLTCILFIQFPEKPLYQWILLLDAPLQISIFKLLGANLTWLQYFMIDFMVESFGYLILLGTIPAFYPKLLPNAMEDKPFTHAGIAVSALFATSLISIYFLFGNTVIEIIASQHIVNQIPIYTAFLTTVLMYLKYLSTSPPADADARTIWVLAGYGFWLVMSFGLAYYLVWVGVSF